MWILSVDENFPGRALSVDLSDGSGKECSRSKMNRRALFYGGSRFNLIWRANKFSPLMSVKLN